MVLDGDAWRVVWCLRERCDVTVMAVVRDCAVRCAAACSVWPSAPRSAEPPEHHEEIAERVSQARAQRGRGHGD